MPLPCEPTVILCQESEHENCFYTMMQEKVGVSEIQRLARLPRPSTYIFSVHRISHDLGG
jgi:hypothetical protein